MGARTFQVPTKIWNNISRSEQWSANQRFLDRTIARGDEIILATPPSKTSAHSFPAQELEYLKSHGYEASVDGTRMLKLLEWK